jgi:hypothetical protein
MDTNRRRRRTPQRPSAETADDNSSDDWRLLFDEYLLIIEKQTKSGPLAEERLRDFFAEGPVDSNGRERYWVRKTVARLDGGRPIYTPRDRSFWYSDREFRVDCKIDPQNSSVHWSGPTVVQDLEYQDSEHIALVPDYNRMAEYQLIEIWLRHDVFAEFMGLSVESRAVPADPTVPVDPPAPPPPLRVEVTALPEIRTVAVQPETPASPRELTAKEWITHEAQRLKQLDQIRAGILKTEFAQMLETNMKEAARTNTSISISPVGWRYIFNHLQEWGLWPITDIE